MQPDVNFDLTEKEGDAEMEILPMGEILPLLGWGVIHDEKGFKIQARTGKGNCNHRGLPLKRWGIGF